MISIFDETLMHAPSLLRELPRGREEISEAYACLARFQEAHPGIRADLLVDQPPGSLRVDYDLLLEHPDGSTVALTWRPDEGVPWSVQYADHWAANYVLSVNGRHVTIQQMLLFLKLAGHRYPDLMDELVNQALIAKAIEEHPPLVSEAELQAAADDFRSARGFHSVEATRRWLEETGISVVRFQERIRRKIQAGKLKEHVTDGQVEAYFEVHREQFDLVQFIRVEVSTEAIASHLMGAAQEQGLLRAIMAQAGEIDGTGLEAVLHSRLACELPSVLVTSSSGEVVGPVAERDRHWVAEILVRQPAALDAKIRVVIQDRLFREWLAERRKQASVHWHWL